MLRGQLHWVVGWDPLRSQPRATFADSYGRADVMVGGIRGDVMVFETAAGAEPRLRLRLTWDARDASRIRWRNELSAGVRRGARSRST